MKRLSLPLHQIKDHYEVAVIGSGYGGSISASRMARAGRSVCLLEKGKEMHPGEYPDQELEAQKEMQMDIEGNHIGSETGLYDFRFNEEINVFKGCGLGGTSLVNANVSLPPEEWVLESESWPDELRQDRETLNEGFNRAREMLQPLPYPSDWPLPAKLKSMEIAAKGWDEGAFYRPPINVTFKDGLNNAGVYQKACTGCGDCVTGCNYSAKNTTLMNYLPDAQKHGAEIFTEVAVDRIERHNDRWVVRYKIMNTGREKFGETTSFITADVVIVAGGTLGSTEIMLRSKKNGLSMSDMTGKHFTGNGDFLGFGYNNDVEANAIGMGAEKPDENDPVGPCITGIIDLRKDEFTEGQKKDGMVIEEGVIPGALSAFVPWMLSFYDKFSGADTDRGFRDFLRECWRKMRSLFGGAYRGAVRNTMTYLVMTHDDGRGEMALKDDRIRIHWNRVGEQPIFQKVSAAMYKVTQKLGGTYIKNPTWNKLFKHRLTTVHPLGGCVMGKDATKGVVNHKGQVFSGTTGSEVYDGLYVSDGSIVPCPLGVNPLLAISGLTERNCQYIAEDRGWTIDYKMNRGDTNVNGNPSKRQEDEKPGIEFTERMSGYFSKGAADYEIGFQKGKTDGFPFSFVLTIQSNDLKGMMGDLQHRADIVGTVQAPLLSNDDLSVSKGEFNLFVEDQGDSGTRFMKYRMKLTAEEDKEFYFVGHKIIHDDPGFDVWDDTTTLFITVYEGANQKAPVFGKGILKIKPADFRKQMTAMKITGITKRIEKMRQKARFLEFFGENIVDVYM